MTNHRTRKGPDSAPHRIEAQHSKNHQRHFTKTLEVVATITLFAALGLMFADGLTDAAGNFEPGQGIAVRIAGVADGR